ncbi:MAG: RloB domain-containing protein [Chitinophaga sp.]|uniref:RloB family protein n=1 Tax=Chitinophaga sp. TaxID=1869181 RepID=UPI0025C08B54|nr:RloB family protein [Chitinophaga sp.]MBV8252361.1 RloB domain-containing protein [Chitinophaga sp.]
MARKGTTKFAKKQDAADVRIEKWRKYQKFLLIVCEDQNTEPAYFTSFEQFFPEHTLYLKIVGAGLDPLGVVTKAIDLKNQLGGLTNREIDEVWVVFDKDDADLNQTRINRFNTAFLTAAKHHFKLAWSNEVFELWLLLHFVDVNPAISLPRQQVYQLLKETVNNRIQPNKIADGHSNPQIIPYLVSHGSEEDAINRAQILLQHHGQTHPIAANPATTMHLLVISLRQWIHYYNYQP